MSATNEISATGPHAAGEDEIVGFAEPITEPDGLRAGTVELAKRARS